ncbi:MAG: DUF3795 domain-containing protein [bacterium]|nr:DUF3795 domain-containing protein [bacterium]
MIDKGLIGRCGLYCGACMIYGVSHRNEPVFAERRRGIAEYFDCGVDEITCEGCGALGEKCWSNDCKLAFCLNEKGYKYCDECADIDSCDKFGGINERYGGLKESMARRREVGDEQWLDEKRVERTCTECDGIIYYYDEEVCVKCAHEKKSK